MCYLCSVKDCFACKRITLIGSALLLSVFNIFAEQQYDSSYYSTLSQKSGEELMAMAYAYLQKESTIDSALVCYSIVANRYDDGLSDEETERCAFAMANIGYLYVFHYFDYQKSYNYFIEALNIANKRKIEKVRGYVNLNLANLLRTYSENSIDGGFDERIIYYYKQSFETASGRGDWYTALVAFYGLAHYVYTNESPNVITEEMEKVRSSAIPDTIPLLQTCRLFCDVLEAYRDGDYDKALNSLQLMIETNDARDTPERYDIYAYTKIARLQIISGDYQKAIVALHKAEEIAELYKVQDLKVEINKLFHDVYAGMGMEDTARVYLLRYHEAKEQLVNRGRLLSFDRMQFLEQLQEANERVAELRRQRRVHRVITTIIVVSAAVLAVLLVMLMHTYRKTRRAYEQLYRRSLEAMEREDKRRNNSAVIARQKNGNTKQTTVDNMHLSDIQEKIDHVLADIEEICSPDFSLNRLAELAGQKYWNMSQIIKDIYGRSFYTLLNEQRINEACRRIIDQEKYGKYTIEAISMSVGFRSRSSFITTFKSITGLTPSEYKKIAKRSNS